MKPVLLIPVIMLFAIPAAMAQTINVDSNCTKAYKNIIALRFYDAQKIIEKEKTENPENLFPIYLENTIDFLTLFIDENKSYYREISDRENIRLDLTDKLPDDNAYKKYLQANINLQWAIAKLKFHDYFSAALGIRRSYLLLNENIEEFPDFEPQQVTLGVLHIIIGMVPDQYQWILSLISMEGSVPQGEQELYVMLEKSNTNKLSYLKPEILFYLGFTEMNLGLDEAKRQQLMIRLSNYTYNNLMLTFLYVNMLARTGHNNKALQLLNKALTWKGYHPFYYLNYLKGEYRLRKLDAGALTDYTTYTNNYKGINFIKDAWRKAGWAHLIQGDTNGYYKMMKNVLSKGETDVGADKEAEKEALSKKVPNITLLKARLLFDGGYYKKSYFLLVNTDTSGFNTSEKLERWYRLGRVLQKTNDFKEAKKYYLITIAAGKNSRRYFAGNAALQLGNIFEMEKNHAEALKYYRLCRNLDFDEYETGIKDKAKQGIKRIEGEE